MAKIIVIILSVWNLLFAIISFVPCIMGGAMGMDSPQAQKDPMAILLSAAFLTFPIVCCVCSIVGLISGIYEYYKTSLFMGVFPIVEAIAVIFTLYVFGEK